MLIMSDDIEFDDNPEIIAEETEDFDEDEI